MRHLVPKALACTVLRGERGSNAPDLPDVSRAKRPPAVYAHVARNNCINKKCQVQVDKNVSKLVLIIRVSY